MAVHLKNKASQDVSCDAYLKHMSKKQNRILKY